MTRWAFGLLASAVLFAPAAARDKAAEDVVTKAIDAHGGKEALSKLLAGTYSMKGTIVVQGMELPFTGTSAYQVPGKMRQDITVSAGGQQLKIVVVANGDKVSQTVGGQAQPLNNDVKDEILQGVVAQEVTQLTPLLGGTRFTLKAEKDGEVGGKPAAVVLVTGKGLNDTRLYFDKTTGLLVRTLRKALNPDGKLVEEESTVSDYTKVNGIQVPQKIAVNHDGKPFLKATMTDYKISEKLDPKLFTSGD
jgi:hypothetical protein